MDATLNERCPDHHAQRAVRDRRSLLRIPKFAVTLLLFNFGIFVGSWVSSIPSFAKAFHLEPKSLGLALLCSGIAGLFCAFPVGKLVDVYGARLIGAFSAPIAPFFFSLVPTIARKGYKPYVFLLLCGVLGSGGPIAFNSRATEIESLWEAPIMSQIHGAWAIGAILGSLLYSGLLYLAKRFGSGAGWEVIFPIMMSIVTANAVLGVALMDKNMDAARHLEPVQTAQETPKGASPAPTPLRQRTPYSRTDVQDTPIPFRPKKLPMQMVRIDWYLVVLAILSGFSLLIEGSMGDWSGLFLMRYAGAEEVQAPWGFSAYSTSMAITRLTIGDMCVRKYGRKTVFAAGNVVAVAGFLTFLTSRNFWMGLLGCAILGCGASNNVPILMSCAAKTKATGRSVAVATLSVVGQCGLMAGPASIGVATAGTGSLRIGLALVVLLCILTNLTGGLLAIDNGNSEQ